ncbi:uncharacterized protein LOC110031281 [Phalaenopsis equestris]|uniref:uncharacterized protein LOC110031281 n=1 Tax=Phalaenopsis equestris TaxID=78828 RepID=UPI0009E602AC|nr:uncharacterized protein LOC110031281 [Phalaenopsis equestris]
MSIASPSALRRLPRGSCSILQLKLIFPFRRCTPLFGADRRFHGNRDGLGCCHTLMRSPEVLFRASRYYARDHRQYDLFNNRNPGDQEFRRAWAQDVDDDDSLWTASDEDEDDRKVDINLNKEIKKLKKTAKENAELVDADDSDELRSLCSESDEEMNLWSGTEDDDDDDIPTEPHPNERSDPYIDKLFDFEATPKNRTFADIMDAVNAEDKPPELSPGQQARKLAVENALKKLKKGPDGRYINVWEVMSDVDILVGAFEKIVSGPEYAELREGGPKKLNLQFFKDIQARMRDPKFQFSPELRLKPKSKLVSRKKWQKVQSRKRKDERR